MPLDYVLAAARWFGRHPDQLGASEHAAAACEKGFEQAKL